MVGSRTLSRKDLCKSVKSVGIILCPTDFTDSHRFLAWILGHADSADDADFFRPIRSWADNPVEGILFFSLLCFNGVSPWP